MKKLSILALAAVGLLVGACSSDRDVAEASNGNLTQEDGDQFISLSINLPTTPQSATRNTTEDDDNNYNYNPETDHEDFELNDGLAREYTVKNALLVVFHPAASGAEDDATFVGAYSIDPNWFTSSDKQVTKYSSKIVQKVGGAVAKNDLLLVVLNRNLLIDFDKDEPKFTVGNTDMLDGTKTFGDFRYSLLEATALGAGVMTGNGFYMANAPLTDKQGSTTTAITGAAIRTLVPINSVYQTEAEALASTDPALVYVERGMAKVTLQALPDGLKLGSDVTKGITFINWTLDHTNIYSYAVRSTVGHESFIPLASELNGKYRYAGFTDITESGPTPYKYRTYFAKDPNYDRNVVTTAPTSPTDLPIDLSYAVNSNYTPEIGDENPQYCFENTFDVDHQTVMNTTLVRLKVQVGGGDDLYIVQGNRGEILLNDAVVTRAKNAAVDYIQDLKTAGTIDYNGTISGADFDVTVPTTAGTVSITVAKADGTAFDAKITAGTAPTDDAIQTAVNAALADVICYEDGMSYYTIRIKHFGDQLTPWHTQEALMPVVGNIYPAGNNRDKNYLGRYGVLRNNWYDIRVSSIKYLGEATPKDYKNDQTTDDELDGYIAAKIHILSWAKRTQSWNL